MLRRRLGNTKATSPGATDPGVQCSVDIPLQPLLQSLVLELLRLTFYTALPKHKVSNVHSATFNPFSVFKKWGGEMRQRKNSQTKTPQLEAFFIPNLVFITKCVESDWQLGLTQMVKGQCSTWGWRRDQSSPGNLFLKKKNINILKTVGKVCS